MIEAQPENTVKSTCPCCGDAGRSAVILCGGCARRVCVYCKPGSEHCGGCRWGSKGAANG